MLVHPSGSYVSISTLLCLPARLRARRQERGTRGCRVSVGRRACLSSCTCAPARTYAQLVAGLGVSTTTAYRYIAEAIDVLSALAPTPADAMKTASTKMPVILDSRLLPMDRLRPTAVLLREALEARHERAGITDPAGRRLWASPVRPGPGPRRQSCASPRHHRRPAGSRRGVLGRQGLPSRWWHRTAALMGPLGDALRRTAGRQPLVRQDPRARRASHGCPQDCISCVNGDALRPASPASSKPPSYST